MGHRAHIIDGNVAVYSHWGAALLHEYQDDWTKTTEAVTALLRDERAKGEKGQPLDDVAAFITKATTDICTEAVYHLHDGKLTVYAPVWMHAGERHGLVALKLENANDFHHYWHVGHRLTAYAAAYSFLPSIRDPIGLAVTNALCDPITHENLWDAKRLVMHKDLEARP